jgi:hypothetical protein
MFMAKQPAALHIRSCRLSQVASEKMGTIIVPLPVDLLASLK